MDFPHAQVIDYENPSREAHRLWQPTMKTVNDYNDYQGSYARVAVIPGRYRRKTAENQGLLWSWFFYMVNSSSVAPSPCIRGAVVRRLRYVTNSDAGRVFRATEAVLRAWVVYLYSRGPKAVRTLYTALYAVHCFLTSLDRSASASGGPWRPSAAARHEKSPGADRSQGKRKPAHVGPAVGCYLRYFLPFVPYRSKAACMQ